MKNSMFNGQQLLKCTATYVLRTKSNKSYISLSALAIWPYQGCRSGS